MIPLRHATASQTRTLGAFLDSTDGETAETALTIANTDVKLMANGGASANKNSGGGTHLVNGHYAFTFDATDTATVGHLRISIKVAGALPVWADVQVMEEAVYDVLYASSADGVNASATRAAVGLATANLDTQLGDIPTVAEFEARTLLAAAYFDPAADTVTVGTNNDKTGYSLTQAFPTNFGDLAITATTGQVTVGTNNDKSGYLISGTKTTLDALNDPTAVDIRTEIDSNSTQLAAIVAGTGATETIVTAANSIDGKTLQETLQIISATTAGKLSGAGTTTETMRSMDDTADRVTATVDTSGNRTAITYNTA